MAAFRAEPSWTGLSVTMPLKQSILGYLDILSEPARMLGTVNTVHSLPGTDGVQLAGHNTDVAGIVSALRFGGFEGGGTTAVLGGGGTATAALAALAALKAVSVDVFVRSPAKASGLASVAVNLGISLRIRPLSEAAEGLVEAGAVVSTLPPRAADPLAAELTAARRLCTGVLLDAAYDPWPSDLATAWTGLAGTAVSGLDMLIYQAAEQVRIFADVHPERVPGVINAMCEAVHAPLR